MNPLDQFAKGAKKFSLSSLYGRIALVLFNGTTDKAALAESDGKLTASLYGKAGSTSTAISLETTGEQKEVNYGKASGTVTAFKVETTGEQDIVLHGKDSAGPNLDALLTDANRILWSRNFRDPILQDGVLLGVAATTIYTCPASTIVEEVWVEIINNTTTTLVASLFVDFDGTGTADTELILDSVALIPAITPIRLGPYSLQATGTVRGLCGTANAVSARVFGWTRPSTP